MTDLCITHTRDIRNAYKTASVKSQGKEPNGKRKHRRKGNIKERGCVHLDWTNLSHDRVQQSDLANTKRNLSAS
jgi:hypothetical protein